MLFMGPTVEHPAHAALTRDSRLERSPREEGVDLVLERAGRGSQLLGGGPRPLEQRPVEAHMGEAEVADAVLARPEQLAAAAQVEVDLGELEAVGRCDERLEPALRGLGQLLLRARDKQAVGLLCATSHAAAQLMQLRETEAV